MWEDLDLHGLAKEIFAFIFGLWIAKKEPVPVSYGVLHKITGAADPSIAGALKRLKSRGFISMKHPFGKPTEYQITVSNEILNKYFEQAGDKEPKLKDLKNCKTEDENKYVKMNNHVKKNVNKQRGYMSVRQPSDYQPLSKSST